MRFIIPAILAAVAIGLFTVWTNPTYQATKGLQAQVAAYDEALDKAQELRKIRDELLNRRNTFSTEDMQKLQHMLPDNVDNIRLVIEINNIAAKHGLALQSVELGELSDSRQARTEFAVGSSGDPVGSVDLAFTVNATYDQFNAFLADLEHSLRIVDVQEIEFTADKAANIAYSVKIRTYWLH
ncbi:type 4a pilus biogenesis protein PilO [Candidatus Parcubacteria bacterium]|nr:type 4a pilus biogenesis protein PilO [Candidatus Parcubacteria bacterium]